MTSRDSDSPNSRKSKLNDSLTGKRARAELVKWLNEQFSQARTGRLPFERQWYTNMAFYFGKQWVTWVGTTPATANLARLVEPPAPPWRVRLVSNKIKPIIRKELSKVTREHPQAFVIPSSSDDNDVAGARAGEQIFEHLHRELKVNKVLRRTVFWKLLCGSAFTKDWWEESEIGPEGVPGTIKFETVTPFHLLVPDYHEEEIESQPYVIHVTAKTPEYVKDVFEEEVQPDSHAASMLEGKFLSALGVNPPKKNFVAVKEICLKPGAKRDFPDGAKFIWAGDTLLDIEDEGMGYPHNEYPYAKFDHIPAGRFYGQSVIEDLIPLQKEYNRGRSQIIESKNVMSKPQIVAPRGSINPSKMTSQPGLIIEYTPGFNPPQVVPPAQLPSYVFEDLNRTIEDMNDISSQHEVTKGSAPPGVTAATAISYLQEEDDSTLAPTVASIEEGVEKIGRHFLSLVNEYWDDARKIKVVGENSQYEVMEFSRSDVAGNTDLRVQAGSATPRSKAGKQAFFMELAQMGVLPPDKLLKYLELTETGRMYEELQVDSRQAQRENVLMSQMAVEYEMDPMTGAPVTDPETGEPVIAPGNDYPTHSWDDDLNHIMEHDLFRKRQKFEEYPHETQLVFERHVTMHKQRVAAMMGMPLEPGDPRLDAIVRGIPIAPVGGDPNAVDSGSGQAAQQETQQ